MIPTTGASRYLGETIESVLTAARHLDAVQIELVWNPVVDVGIDPAEIAARYGDRIEYFIQPRPLAMAANWNACIRRACGHWVHIVHDDDRLVPDFYRRYEAMSQRHPDAAMMISRALAIDAEGRPSDARKPDPGCDDAGRVVDALAKLVEQNFVAASSAVVRRGVYETVGGFDESLHFPVDWEMWIRAAATGCVVYSDEPCSERRIHPEAETLRHARVGQNLADIAQVIARGAASLPEAARYDVEARAKKRYAAHALTWRQRFHREGEHESAWIHATWALRLQPSLRHLWLWTQSWMKMRGFARRSPTPPDEQ